MRSKVMTARPAARKGNGSRSPAAGTSLSKKTVAVATKRAEPMVQMVERVRTASRSTVEVTKKTGELPIPVATFVF